MGNECRPTRHGVPGGIGLMNEASAARCLASAGYRVHNSRGVWWLQMPTGFCKPVNPLRPMLPSATSPRYSQSFLGFSHPTKSLEFANHRWDVMAIEEKALREFEIDRLKRKRRTAVRKALRNLRIDPITNIDAALSEMNAICISAAERTGHGLPADYYRTHRKRWETFMKNEFQISGREWWGVWYESRLIAYLYAFLIDKTMHISATKSHSDELRQRPNDAVVYSFLEYCRDHDECVEVVFGDVSLDNPSLNQFKEQFGFRRRSIPIYRKIRFPFSVAAFLRGQLALRSEQ